MPDDVKNLEKVQDSLDSVTKALKEVTAKVTETAEQANKEMKNLGKLTEETKQKADEGLAKHGELANRMTELEQKVVRAAGGGRAARAKSLGATVLENEEVKAYMAKYANGGHGKLTIEVNQAITSVSTDSDGAAGDMVAPDRQAGVNLLPRRPLVVRDLLLPGRTSSNMIEYVKQTGFTNSAAIQTEGATKAESTMKFDLVQSPVRTIAHFVKASKQILSDAPQLASIIDGELRYGLAYAEELQLLMGSGSGINLNGIYTQAAAYSAPYTPGGTVTMIDQLRLAFLQAFLALYPPTAAVLNPIDWDRIEGIKDTLGRYIIGNPQGGLQPTLWGKVVVPTMAMTVDKFLAGAFKPTAQIFDREKASVTISTEDGNNFTQNMVTVLCEERLALADYRPEAFIKGDFGNIT